MEIKNASQFEKFDINEFLRQKKLMVNGVKPWTEFGNSDKILGTDIEVVIIEDHTEYVDSQGNKLEGTTNRFEKLHLRMNGDKNVPLGTIVTPVNAKAKLYAKKGSTYRNQLSITCDDLRAVATTNKGA